MLKSEGQKPFNKGRKAWIKRMTGRAKESPPRCKKPRQKTWKCGIACRPAFSLWCGECGRRSPALHHKNVAQANVKSKRKLTSSHYLDSGISVFCFKDQIPQTSCSLMVKMQQCSFLLMFGTTWNILSKVKLFATQSKS
jgi:hypothetical protein